MEAGAGTLERTTCGTALRGEGVCGERRATVGELAMEELARSRSSSAEDEGSMRSLYLFAPSVSPM